MINRRRGREIYPGVDNRFVICDVCGKKFRVRDTVRIVDRFNLLNNMIVCLADADQANPQIKPFYIQEDLLLRKDYVRPEATFMTYTNFENEDRLSTAPQYLVATVEPISREIQLIWQGALDPGNALLLGYRIYRADEAYGIFEIIVQNTHSSATYYLDESADVDSAYLYKVVAVTTLGLSPDSNYAYFPKEFPSNNYLVLTQDYTKFIALTQNNYNIIIEN